MQKRLNVFKGNSVKSRVSKSSKTKANCVSTSVNKNGNPSCENDEEDLANTTSKVRNQIVKWLSNQSNIRLRQLKEYKDYEVKLRQNAGTGGPLVATVLCMMCNNNVHLAVDQRNSVKLSNWIHHVKQCCIQGKGQNDKGQLMLTSFFSGPGSSSEKSNSISIPESDQSVLFHSTDDVTASDVNNLSDE